MKNPKFISYKKLDVPNILLNIPVMRNATLICVKRVSVFSVVLFYIHLNSDHMTRYRDLTA